MGRDIFLFRRKFLDGCLKQQRREWASLGPSARDWLNLLWLKDKKESRDSEMITGKREWKRRKNTSSSSVVCASD